MTELKDTTDILVIGGGQAGLAMGYFLQLKGCQFQILERHRRIGDSWRRRYDSLKLFSPREFSSLPGLPLPGDKNGFASKDEIAGYLEDYASRLGLPVVCGTGVTSLQRAGGGFRSKTENGFEVTSRAVIIATGAFQIPAVPALAKDLAPSVSQLSPDTYRNPSQIQVGTVLVVGDGATGRQIALELSRTHPVILSRGRTRSVSPAFILGKSNFWWMERLGLSRAPYTSPLGRWFRKRDPFPGLQLTLFNLRRGGIRVVKRLTGVEGRTVTFANGATADVASVIWATGYHDDSTWVDIPEVKGSKGNFIERRGLTAVPNLYFIGRNWQWTRASALLFGVARDAQYLMPFIRDGLEKVGDGASARFKMNAFLAAATDKRTLVTSIKVALVVGTVLGLINYGDRIFLRHDMRLADWIKLVLTYVVPFCVATYSAARFAVEHRDGPAPISHRVVK